MQSAPFVRPFANALAMAAAMALAFAGAASAQPQRAFKLGGSDELWDMTMKMEMPGMPMAMPAQTHQMCVKKNHRPEDAIPANDECRVLDSKTVGNKTTFTMDCAGKDPMTVRGEITTTASGYEGTMRMKGKRKGDDMEMTQVFSGRKVGACTDQTEQIVAKAKADSDAVVAKTCSESLEKFVAAMFVGQGAMCGGQKKAFCDKAGGLTRDLREPATHRAVVAKYGRENLQQAAQGCGLDYAGAVSAACGKAQQGRDWAFIGSGSCDDAVRAAGPTHCKGRDYYLVDRSLVPLCNRYAALSRGSGAGSQAAGSPPPRTASSAPPPSAQPADEPKPDAMKQSIDALRKVLPF